MGKRKSRPGATNDDGDEDGPPLSKIQKINKIKSKIVRSRLYNEHKKQKKKQRDEARKKRKEEEALAMAEGRPVPAKQEPRTIENQRITDETMITDVDEELIAGEQQDEFSEHFQALRPPKVLVTTCLSCTTVMYKFAADLMEVLPSAVFYKRRGYRLSSICEYAAKRDFTAVVVLNEDQKLINGMLVINVPDGPTAHFRVRSVKLSEDIKGAGEPCNFKPEVILNNFSTRLGHRVARLLASLFTQDPTFKGRRVVTFHNQRDFVFVRHHRYIFEEKEKTNKAGQKRKVLQARLQELGPRFTLKLLSLQKGPFTETGATYEWVRKPDLGKSKKFFFL